MKEIPLTQGQFAIVDDEDFEYLNQWKWCAMPAKNGYYAVRTQYSEAKNKKTIYMHVFIFTNESKEYVVDHVDSDGLNNQRSNLRKCSTVQNSYNRQKQTKKSTSKYKGVYWYVSRRKWRAQIMVNHKNLTLGEFHTEKEAAIAYNVAAKNHFGQFAKLNLLNNVLDRSCSV